MGNEEATADVRAVLYELAERYGAMDSDGVLALFAGDDTVLVGTGADEVRFGMAETRLQVERDLSQADEVSFGIENLRVNLFGDAAFGYADATFAGSAAGTAFEIPGRWTTGLVRTDDGWRIAQFHVSVAYEEQAQGESFPG